MSQKTQTNDFINAYVDGDILVYQAAAATEHPIEWEPGFWTLHGFMEEAVEHFNDTLNAIIQAMSEHYQMPVHAILCMSDVTHNYRKDIWPQYKANRATKRVPLCRRPLHAYVLNHTVNLTYKYLEGDDVLGIEMTRRPGKGEHRVCVSIDKDLNTIPGEHYNFGKDEFYDVDSFEADFNHALQTLTGDTADGYPGCPGIGPKKAMLLLDGCTTEEELWNAVVKAYEKAGQSEEQALTMARLAYILRDGDYDFKKGAVRLWTPRS